MRGLPCRGDIDLDHDLADGDARIGCPLLVLWGADGFVGQRYDALATWRTKSAGPIEGGPLDCGHFLAEEQPGATRDAMRRFFA